MSNIIKFPKTPKSPMMDPVIPDAPRAEGRSLMAGLVKFVWMVTLLIWPLLKWVLSIDVLFQFVRMLYHWNTPGAFAVSTFVLHFALLTGLTYYVSVYKPKGL